MDRRRYISKPIPVARPLPYEDEGARFITCATDLSTLEVPDIAAIIMRINRRATDVFFEAMRRGVLGFEHPLEGARGQNRSYIYSFGLPRAAQAAVTLFRAWWNWCHPFGVKDDKKTPAMRLGLIDRPLD